MRRRVRGTGVFCLSAFVIIAHTTAAHADGDDDSTSSGLSEVKVTASRLNLLGTADTASQGSVTQQELDLRPAYRVGQLLESVPGLVVTVHSGEGKANQYLARGFNLDHGTDIANFVDDMPINRPTGGLYYGHVDGPFAHPDDFRKIAGTVRYSHGTDADGYSATAMFFHGEGNMTTDQPLRAIQAGLIGRFGTLDPSDGSLSQRFSLSAHYATGDEQWKLSSSAYFIRITMTLWNDFTHFLDDRVNADQEAQDEARSTGGAQVAFTLTHAFGSVSNDLIVGAQLRYDSAYVDRKHTLERIPLNYCSVGQTDGSTLQVPMTGGICNADNVHLLDLGPYIEDTVRWTPWFRTILGLREEYYRASDSSLTTGFHGTAHESLFQPKGTLVVGPFADTEVYLSAGRGFHSDDVRGVFGTVPIEGVPGTAGTTPLLEPTTGIELGIRSNIVPKLAMQLALFRQQFNSELTYDADAGQDAASAPSRREGIELSAQYRPLPWMELNTDLAVSRARYRGDLAAYRLDGPYIANAPSFIGSFGVLIDNKGPWSGGLQWRKLGAYPISDGNSFPQDKGYSEFNLDAGYKLTPHLKLQLSLYNLFNTKGNSSAFYYTARLPGEPAEGVEGFQVHPLEPLSGVLKVTATF